jgi:hypothetical protein
VPVYMWLCQCMFKLNKLPTAYTCLTGSNVHTAFFTLHCGSYLHGWQHLQVRGQGPDHRHLDTITHLTDDVVAPLAAHGHHATDLGQTDLTAGEAMVSVSTASHTYASK